MDRVSSGATADYMQERTRWAHSLIQSAKATLYGTTEEQKQARLQVALSIPSLFEDNWLVLIKAAADRGEWSAQIPIPVDFDRHPDPMAKTKWAAFQELSTAYLSELGYMVNFDESHTDGADTEPSMASTVYSFNISW